MWAYGIGEFVSCDPCQQIYSKKDIFSHIPGELYKKTVAHIMRLLWVQRVLCPGCGGETDFIYGEEFINTLRNKLTKNVYSALVVARNDEGIVGYMDGYVWDFDTLYETDLSLHYAQVPCSILRDRVETLLQKPIWEMIYFSEAWFVQSHSWLSNFFSLYPHIFWSFDEKYRHTPGITELDTNSKTLFRIYEIMGSRITQFDPALITGVHPDYSSALAVFDSPVHDFTTKYNMTAREFIRNFMK
jgi:hypothetical protein